jgi:hypothetical protein
MSIERRTSNPGKRERLARNRHKRCKRLDSQGRWKKVGSRHFFRGDSISSLAVADRRKPRGERALESARRTHPNL